MIIAIKDSGQVEKFYPVVDRAAQDRRVRTVSKEVKEIYISSGRGTCFLTLLWSDACQPLFYDRR